MAALGPADADTLASVGREKRAALRRLATMLDAGSVAATAQEATR
jgi:hypothetical protein